MEQQDKVDGCSVKLSLLRVIAKAFKRSSLPECEIFGVFDGSGGCNWLLKYCEVPQPDYRGEETVEACLKFCVL